MVTTCTRFALSLNAYKQRLKARGGYRVIEPPVGSFLLPGKMASTEERRFVPTQLLLEKLIVSTCIRSLYPLASINAQHENIETRDMTNILSAMQFLVMVTCFFTPTVQRALGLRNLSVACMCFVSIMWLMLALSTSLAVFTTGVILVGIARGLLYPTILTITSSLYEQQEQGKVVAFVEFSWGLCSLIGLPLVGLLMSIDFKLPFFVLSGVCLVLACASFWVLRWVDKVKGKTDSGKLSERRSLCSYVSQFLGVVTMVCRTPEAVAMLITNFCVVVAMNIAFISFGLWLVFTHGFGAAGVGAAGFVIGAAEFMAEGVLLILLRHWPGKAGHLYILRMFFVGSMLSYGGLAFVLQPGIHVAVGLTGFFFTFFCFETTIVCQLGMVGSVTYNLSTTEDAATTATSSEYIDGVSTIVSGGPDDAGNAGKKDEGIMESASFMSTSLGGVIGPIISTYLWDAGAAWPGIAGVIFTLVSLLAWVLLGHLNGHGSPEKG